MQPLPLLPLGAVLVPGQVLPVAITEPRDQALVQDLLSQPEERREVGIVTVKAGFAPEYAEPTQLFRTGCLASVRYIAPGSTQNQPDGAQLVLTGKHRFHLYGVLKKSAKDYPEGMIGELPDDRQDPHQAAVLADRVDTLFAQYRALRGEPAIELPDDPEFLSYLITVALPLPVAERVALLTEPSTVDRLSLAKQLLLRELTVFKATRSTPEQPIPVNLSPH